MFGSVLGAVEAEIGEQSLGALDRGREPRAVLRSPELLAWIGELVEGLVGAHLDPLGQQVLAERELPAEDGGSVGIRVHHVYQVRVRPGDVELRPFPEPTLL